MTRPTKARLEELKRGLVCLVPLQRIAGLTCHEKTLCDCQVLEVFSEVDALQAEVDELRYGNSLSYTEGIALRSEFDRCFNAMTKAEKSMDHYKERAIKAEKELDELKKRR